MVETIRLVAEFFLLFMLVLSIDDLFMDLGYYYFSCKKNRENLRVSDLDNVLPKLIAVFIPAWQEDNVIYDMLHHNLTTINYPKAFYHFFVGVYPNDLATQKAIKPLLTGFRNLHMVVNEREGPTNKANNINYMYKKLKEYERETGMRFSIVGIHDSEDVIHPTSLKLINYLIPRYPVVQLPVFPLQPYPTLRNFFRYLTTGTYADEFAENHFRGMVAREVAGLLVPSAGTGFFISREALELVEGKRGNASLLNENSLTEDYELSLYMQKMGINVHYFIEGLHRVDPKGKILKEYIATREFFPNTLYEAVKQKARWIYGITFQSRNYFKMKDFNWRQRYSYFRDVKAKYANAVLLPGYILLLYVVLSYLTDLPVLFPYYSRGWILSLVLTAFSLERQIMRAIALKNIYGWRSALLSNFLPPLLPIRFVWGNLLNFLATLRAWRIYFFGTPKTKAKWDKTKHSYLPPDILAVYKRKLGDLLLEKGLLEPRKLQEVLAAIQENPKKLGEAVLEKQLLSENQLLLVFGELWGTGYLENIDRMANPGLARIFPKSLAVEFQVVPLMAWNSKILLGSSRQIEEQEANKILKETGREPFITLVPQDQIRKVAALIYACQPKDFHFSSKRIGEVLLEKGMADLEQLLLAFNLQNLSGKKLGEILVELGVVEQADVETLFSSAEAAASVED